MAGWFCTANEEPPSIPACLLPSLRAPRLGCSSSGPGRGGWEGAVWCTTAQVLGSISRKQAPLTASCAPLSEALGFSEPRCPRLQSGTLGRGLPSGAGSGLGK